MPCVWLKTSEIIQVVPEHAEGAIGKTFEARSITNAVFHEGITETTNVGQTLSGGRIGDLNCNLARLRGLRAGQLRFVHRYGSAKIGAILRQDVT